MTVAFISATGYVSKTDQYTKSYPDFSLGGNQLGKQTLHGIKLYFCNEREFSKRSEINNIVPV